MAIIDYDFAWPTEYRYDVLTAGAVATTVQNTVAACATALSVTLLETARVRDDGVHFRIRLDNTEMSPSFVKRKIKAEVSSVVLSTYSDISDDYKGKHIFKRNFYCDEGDPGDAAVDAWIDGFAQYARP